jgi:cytoskeletal protein CcmA (bactofilin family)
VAIFKKEDLTLPKEPAPAPARENRKEKTVTLKTDEITTILGKGSQFEGKLNFEGTLQIEGVFNGEIRSESILVVGEGARVSAEIEVGTIIINGEVRGNVRARNSVEIKKPGRLYGNIFTPSLTIEKGVVFEGNCKMENLDRAAPPPLEKPHGRNEQEKK